MTGPSREFLLTALAISGSILLSWAVFQGVLRRKHRQRVVALRNSLPLLGKVFREGRSFPEAIQLLADLAPDPIRTEFARLRFLTSRGADAETLIAELRARFDCFEADYIAALIETFPEEPREIADGLSHLEEIRQRRDTAQQKAALAARAWRTAIRSLLLAIPLGLSALFATNAPIVSEFRARVNDQPAVLGLLSGLFLSAVWLVLILQKQDESENVFDEPG